MLGPYNLLADTLLHGSQTFRGGDFHRTSAALQREETAEKKETDSIVGLFVSCLFT